jgi:hypothetical protein
MSATEASPAPDVGLDSQVLAVTDAYSEAEATVRTLADRNFPIEHMRIVGDGLKWVERVTGKLTIWGAVARGAVGGAVTGALICWIFGLVDWVSPILTGIILALYGLVFGALIGAVSGAIYYLLTSSRRNFLSEESLMPTRYEVLVDTAFATEARRLLTAGATDTTASDRPRNPEGSI